MSESDVAPYYSLYSFKVQPGLIQIKAFGRGFCAYEGPFFGRSQFALYLAPVSAPPRFSGAFLYSLSFKREKRLMSAKCQRQTSGSSMADPLCGD